MIGADILFPNSTRSRASLLVVLIFLFAGCSKTTTVEYVVPNGYSGILKIRAMQRNGVSIGKTNQIIRLVFPESGVLAITSRLPSEQWHIPIARYRNGTAIPVVTDGAGNPAAVSFRSVGSIDDKEEWFVIGTFEDLKAAKEKKDGFKWPSN